MTPTYKEIITQIGAQIKARKKLLLLRTLSIVWPVLLAVAAIYIASHVYGKEYLEQVLFSFPNIFYFFGYILLAFIYMSVVGFIFEIEKRIWIDSFFDKREMSSSASWGLAKKLLWPAIVFRFNVFFKYYLTPLVLVLLIVFSPLFAIKDIDAYLTPNIMLTYGVVAMLSIISCLIYFYYLRIRLRFSWFVFLDLYKGGTLELHSIYEKMDLLNVTAKSEGFKKALILTVGVDTIGAITKQLVVLMTEGLKATSLIPGIGDAGRMLGDMTRVYGQELVRQVTSYAEIVSIYILYRTAHQQTFGKEQEVNEYMYTNNTN